MADRRYEEAPTLDPAIREQMSNALYEKFYANALPREEFDKQMAGKSDFDLANSAYDTFYKGKLPRDQFNKQIGFTSASGSTQGAIMSGMSLGLTDEVSGAVSGAASWLRGEGFGTGYDRTTRGMRENREVFRQNNPYLATGLEIGGAATSTPLRTGAALMRSGAASVPALTSPVVTGALQGAGLGAVSGAADAEGGFLPRLKGGAEGLATGAAVAPAISVASYLMAPMARGAKNILGLGNPVQQAERQVGQALDQSKIDTATARALMNAAPADKPVVLADVGGPATRQLAASAANRPGPAMTTADNLVESRRFGAPDRIASDVDRMIAPGSGDGVADVTQGLIRQRETAAAPLYEAAFSKPYGMNDEVRNFLQSKEAKQGLARGFNIQRIENEARQLRGEPPVPMTDPAIQFAEDGTPKIIGQPNMRSLDSIKRGLDAMLEEYRGPDGRLKLDEAGRALNDLRKSFVNQLDRGNPDYAAARAAWAGPSESMDAINMGRRLITADRDTIARMLDNIPEGNREFFKLGAARALTDRTTDPSAAGNFVRRMVEDRTLSGKIQRLFDSPEEYQNFVKSMQAELTMRDTNRAISPRVGSPTARLLMGNDAMDEGIGGLAGDLLRLGARGGKPSWEMLERLRTRSKQGGVDTSAQIAQALMNPERAGTMRALDRVDARKAFDALSAHERELMLRALTSGAAAAIPMQTN